MKRYLNADVKITKHAMERFFQRRINITRRQNELNPYKKMLGMVLRSKLINTKNKEGNIIEYRECSGIIFICCRELSKDFFQKDKLTVVTCELTKANLVETQAKGYAVESLFLGKYLEAKML